MDKNLVIAGRIVGGLIAAGIAIAGAAASRAETGPLPVYDQLCIVPAYVNGSHTQGGVLIKHEDNCVDAVNPADYGSGNQVIIIP